MQPTPYERKYDLTNDDGQDLRTQLDVELDDVARCFLETLTNLALIQRDDGQLANKSVGVEQLKAELIAGFNPPEPFQPFRLYEISDSFVTDDGKWYIVNTSFIAGATVDPNLEDVTLVYDFAAVRVDTIAAKDAAEAAQTAAELARDQAQSAATSASNDAVQTGQDRQAAANSASSAASSASSASNSANASAASASNAANAEQAAEAAEAKAELWADEDENVEVETGRYSARHWAQKAAELGGDPNQFQVTTSTGTQTLTEALDQRVIHVGDLAARNALPVAGLADGQALHVVGIGDFRWSSTTSEWLPDGDVITPEMYGDLTVGEDWALALQASADAAAGRTWSLAGVTYKTSRQINVAYGTRVRASPDTLIDGGLITVAGNAPDNSVVKFGDGSLTQIADLSQTAAAGKNILVFAADHGLSIGDYICIYNPTDSSYSSHRTYYRAGEWCQVASVNSSTEVALTSPTFATYAPSDVDIYKLGGGSVSFSGGLRVSCEGSGVLLSAINLYRCVDSDISGLKGIAVNNNAGILINQCVNLYGTGVLAHHTGTAGAGTDYGLLIANSQHLDITGYFTAKRHGVTHGGYDTPGAVPCRDSKIRGTFATSSTIGIPAANWHGNAEYCLFDGNMLGGVTVAGNHNTVRGTAHAGATGVAVLFSELTGFNHDLSGVKFIGTVDPKANAGGRGLIDLGGAAVAEAADTLPGVIDLSGCVVDAPNATRIVLLRGREHTTTPSVKMNGFWIQRASAGGESLVLIDRAVGTGNWNTIDLTNFRMFGDGVFNISDADIVVGQVSRTVNLTTNTGTNSVTGTITFPFSFGQTPSIQVGHYQGYIGSAVPVATVSGEGPGGFTIGLRTPDASNFSSAVSVTMTYTATLDYGT